MQKKVYFCSMKMTLLVVGKTLDSRLSELISEYTNRLGHYVPFSISVLPELKNAKSLSTSQQKQLEAEMILKAVPSSAELILLDEHGKEFRSIAFAQFLQKKMTSGKDIIFLIGGPYGFSDSVYQRANDLLSLSQMTFSHQMIRLLFVEQLYRGFTILKGEPYHHE